MIGSTASGLTCDEQLDGVGRGALSCYQDCLDAQSNKCEVTKAFSVIGPLAIFMALVGFSRGEALCGFFGCGSNGSVCKKSGAKIMSAMFALLGALSFLIVFAIAASNYTGTVDTTSTCGYDLASIKVVSYGPSFYLSVVAFVTSLVAAGQIVAMPIQAEGAN